MKKLALMAAVAAIAATPAFAKSTTVTTTSVGTPPGHSYTVVDRDMQNDTVRYTTTTTSVKKQVDAEGNPDFTGRYALEDGRILAVEDIDTAFIEDGGSRFYAPKGAYTTKGGSTFFTEDGQILRLENPPEIVYVDTDDLVGDDANIEVRRN
jgi:hypothetical protein